MNSSYSSQREGPLPDTFTGLAFMASGRERLHILNKTITATMSARILLHRADKVTELPC